MDVRSLSIFLTLFDRMLHPCKKCLKILKLDIYIYMSKKIKILLEIKEKILSLLKIFFLLHNKNSELMDVISYTCLTFF